MYKLRKDDNAPERFSLQYFLVPNLLEPLYTAENLTWEDVERFIKSTATDLNDYTWIHDLIRLMDKQVSIEDTGNWSVL